MKLLVVSPHLDDETLGAGGTMLKYAQAGEQVYWLNVSNTCAEYGFSEELVRQREDQRIRVAKKLGVAEAFDMKLQPSCLEQYKDSDVIAQMGKIINRIQPEIIITSYPGDMHSDHQKVFSWVKVFSKSFRNVALEKFFLMEIVSETDFALPINQFAPNYFVDITDQLEKKLEIVQIYSQEIGEHPFPRSIENIKAMATSRGAIAGTKYAEAFILVRGIEK